MLDVSTEMGERLAGLLCVVLVAGAAVLGTSAGGSAAVPAGDGYAAEHHPVEPPRSVEPTMAPGQAGTGPVAASQGQPQEIDRDSVLLHVDVYANGTARWRVEYRTRLDDPATTDAFRSLQESIRENPENYSADFFSRIRAAIASAENATGREMEGEDFDVHTEVRHLPQSYGIVVYTYTWKGFAAVDGDRLVIGDALSGLFLDENERLLVSWPEGYEFASVSPPVDTRREHAAIWTGPTEFGPDEPRLAVAPRPGLVERFGPAAAGVAAVAAVAAALAWGARRRYRGDAAASGRGDRGRESDRELLSNEERVVRLLEERGGRLKQQDVVEELGWTEAKTSQVVSDLREQGRIESFRLGRENVLSLSDAGGRTERVD